MKKIISLIMLLLFTTVVFSIDKRNLLTNYYSRKYINNSLVKDYSWIKYPSYNDREAWLHLPEGIRKKTIDEGEKFLGYSWPTITATMYLEFTRTGNRSIVDHAISTRRRALQTLILAELMEGKGRFLDDIINGIFTYCEQTYWGMSATFYMYGFDTSVGSINKPNTVVPDIDDPIVDLSVGDVAADLAWAWYFFHNEFDKISPVISKRLKSELQKKVLNPYYERYDFWWITGWGEGDIFFENLNYTMNNWTTWITYNMLTCILLIEEDPQKKQNGVYKTMSSINRFINLYPEDGACLEGPSYWAVAGGMLFNYLDLLKRNTNGKIDIFGDELIKNMGRFIYRAYISKGVHYINFSDASPRISHNPGHMFRFGKAIEDPVMKEFGAFLLKESNFGEEAVIGPMGETLENLFNLEGWQETRASEPLISEFYFPDSEIALARDKSGTTDEFYFAAWGGNNGGGHNHNDKGSCILFFNGSPVLIDVGGSSTEMHNLPLINGIAQARGAKYKANNSKYSSSKTKVSFSTDISGAYPPEAKVKKWVRSYTLERGKKFTIHDSFQLTQNFGNTRLHFMTKLQSRVIKPGILELSGNEFFLHMKFNPSMLSVSIEKTTLGDEISRIVFDLKSNNLSGNVLIEIVEVK